MEIIENQQQISKLVALIPPKFYNFKHSENDEDFIRNKRPTPTSLCSKKFKSIGGSAIGNPAEEADAVQQVNSDEDETTAIEIDFIENDDAKKSKKAAKLAKLDPFSFSKQPNTAIVVPNATTLKIEPMKISNAVELKEKLRSRIQELRALRTGGSDPKSKQELLEKRKEQKLKKHTKTVKQFPKPKLDIEQFTNTNTNDDSTIVSEMTFGNLDFGIKEVKKGPKDVHSLLKLVHYLLI